MEKSSWSNIPVYLMEVAVVQVEDAEKLGCHLSCTLGHHHSTFVAIVGHYCCIGANKFVENVGGLAGLVDHDDYCRDIAMMLS